MLNKRLLGLFMVLVPLTVQADNHDAATTGSITTEVVEQDFVNYSASYFARFHPVTALDMVKQVPGFQLDDNINELRGFGGVAGNILINDRRLSTKQDTLSAMLTRIPAGSVERIELIRGQVRNIDMRGQSGVLNIILREGIPAAIQWETAIRQTFGHGPLKPEGRISLSDNWKGFDFNIGIDGRWHSVGRHGIDLIYDGNDILQDTRIDNRENRNRFLKANLNSAGWWGDTFIQTNTVIDIQKRHTLTNSDRTSELTGIERNVLFDNLVTDPIFEAGLDLERYLLPDLTGKAILLYVQVDREIFSGQRDTNSTGTLTLNRLATGKLDSTEKISRLEFDWSRYANHLLQFNVERADNTLDSTLMQTDDTGTGEVIIDVPGANGIVEEIRWDALLKDTWTLGRLELDYGLGAETSRITQTGDTELERSFFFVKPQSVVTWSWLNNDLSRLRLAREISQLNLESFVSATEFLDNDIALGNPNIKPEAIWKLELSHEKRFGGKGLIKLTTFHHWITDVLDLLPITSTFEAPGNIGDGRRWGLLWESSTPLDWLNLEAARLDVNLRWQDSSVIDPVTGQNRALSVPVVDGGPIRLNIENEYAFEIEYRQDFQKQQVAWGWTVLERAEQYQYKVNELLVYDENTELLAYIETSRWFGIKMAILAENLLNFHEDRNRSIFIGERDRSSLNRLEVRDATRGVRLSFSMSGSF